MASAFSAAVALIGCGSNGGSATSSDASTDAADAAETSDALGEEAGPDALASACAPATGSGQGPTPASLGARFSNAGALADPSFYPIGAFYQSPSDPAAGGVSNAMALASMGVNLIVTYVSPSKPDGSLDSTQLLTELTAWKSAGIRVIPDTTFPRFDIAAGLSLLAAHPELASTIVGWQPISDESDGKYTDGTGLHGPLNVKAEGAAGRKADPTRPIWANFAELMLRGGPMVFYHPASVNPASSGTGTYQGDVDAYASAVDMASFDFYALRTPKYYSADPRYEFDSKGNAISYNGLWVYGRITDSLRASLANVRPDAPVMPIIEDADPWETTKQAGPSLDELSSIVWLTIIHGARGIIYFGHTFGNDTNGSGSAPNSLTAANQFDIANKMSMLTALHARINGLARVLNSPTQGVILKGDADFQHDGREQLPAGFIASSSTDIPIDTMVRVLDGKTYWFAIASGDEGHTASGATTGTFQVACAAGKTITVADEGRTVTADASGKFTDTFGPYQMHLYVW